jgi:vacuolar-type H+-ATPase subunit H
MRLRLDIRIVQVGEQVAAANNSISEAEQSTSQIVDEAQAQAHEDARALINQAEQNASQIIEEAKRQGEETTNNIVAESERTASRIIEEARERAKSESQGLFETPPPDGGTIAKARERAEQNAHKFKRQAALLLSTAKRFPEKVWWLIALSLRR